MSDYIQIPSYLSDAVQEDSAVVLASSDSDQVACDLYSCYTDTSCVADTSTCSGDGCGSYSSCSSDGSCSSDCADSTPVLEPPTWETSNTCTKIIVRVIDPGDYTYFSYSLRDSSGNTIYDGPTDYAKTKTYTFSGLDINTTYRVYVSWSTTTSGEGSYEYQSVSTTLEKWSWNRSNGYATAEETSSAYSAVTGGGDTSDFSYLVWNDFVDKVNDYYLVQGGGWDQEYTTYWSARMTADDTTLTALRFNSVRHQLDLIDNTGIPVVYANKSLVYGWYFTQMATSLNTAIDGG